MYILQIGGKKKFLTKLRIITMPRFGLKIKRLDTQEKDEGGMNKSKHII